MHSRFKVESFSKIKRIVYCLVWPIIILPVIWIWMKYKRKDEKHIRKTVIVIQILFDWQALRGGNITSFFDIFATSWMLQYHKICLIKTRCTYYYFPYNRRSSIDFVVVEQWFKLPLYKLKSVMDKRMYLVVVHNFVWIISLIVFWKDATSLYLMG